MVTVVDEGYLVGVVGAVAELATGSADNVHGLGADVLFEVFDVVSGCNGIIDSVADLGPHLHGRPR